MTGARKGRRDYLRYGLNVATVYLVSLDFHLGASKMFSENFAGASKTGASLLSPLERRLARWAVPRMPSWLGTERLTMMTLVWCALVALFGGLAASDRRWLWATSVVIILQYATDFLDGKVGKHRGTGLVRWGFYMDHMLDYLFLCAIVVGYSFLLPASAHFDLLVVLAACGGLMVNSFLTFAATQRFRISHRGFGPTEFRIALIIINTLLIFYGTRRMESALPYVAAGGFAILFVLVLMTQRQVRRLDMEAKSRAAASRHLSLDRKEAA